MIPRPLGDRLVVKELDREGRFTDSVLIRPDRTKDNVIVRGEVLAVGPGKLDEHYGNHKPVPVKVGDVIKFPAYAGKAYKTKEGEKFLIMETKFILSVVDA